MPVPSHHKPGGGFRNPWPLPPDAIEQADVPFWRIARWMLSFASRTRNARRPVPIERRSAADFDVPVASGTVRVTWLGHTAVLLQYPGGPNVLLDPMLGNRASPFSFMGPERETPLPVRWDDLPRIDVVVLSHDHYDHLDRGTVEWLNGRDRPQFVVPLGVGGHLRAWMQSPRVVELDWEASTRPEGTPLTLTAVPARHFSGRSGLDRDKTLWASFILKAPGGPTIYFGGDSGYAPFYAAIRARHGAPDLALMPIGAYEPRWFMRPVHANPEEAVQAALDLGARTVLGTHWGSFILTDEPMDEPPPRFLAEAARRGLDGRVLPVGGVLEVAAKRPATEAA